GRRKEGPAHHLAGEDEAQHGALLGRLHHVDDQRHLWQVGMLLQGKLRQDLQRAVLHPRGMVGLYARPRPAAARLHLAALQGEGDVVAAGIARDELQLRAEDTVECFRERVGVGIAAGTADEHLARVEILEAGDAGLAPCGADAHLIVGAADPAEIGALELRALLAEKRLEGDGAADGAEGAAVARRCLREPVGEAQAAGAFHVARNDGRIARQVPAHVPSEQPRVDVVAAAYAVADVEVDRARLSERAGREERGAQEESLHRRRRMPCAVRDRRARVAVHSRCLRIPDMVQTCPFEQRDLSEVTALFPGFRETFLGNPWADASLPSWVARDGGRIVGVLGVMPRPMRLRGKPVRAAVLSQHGSAAKELLRAALSGPQDLTLSDSADDALRRAWEACGGSTVTLYGLQWRRLLRPASFGLGRLPGVAGR